MSTLRMTNGFNRLSDANLLTRSTGIVAAMTGNTDLPTPLPTLAVVQDCIDDYAAALNKAQGGSVYDRAAKNAKRKELIALLHNLGNYVLFTAPGAMNWWQNPRALISQRGLQPLPQ